jgi:hypothetical protein
MLLTQVEAIQTLLTSSTPSNPFHEPAALVDTSVIDHVEP